MHIKKSYIYDFSHIYMIIAKQKSYIYDFIICIMHIYMTFPCFVVFSILTINKKNRGCLQREMVKNKTKESKSKKKITI